MIDIKALKSRFIDLAIRGKLVPQLDEEPSVEQIGEVPAEVPFEIPEKWKWQTLSDVGYFISGWTPKSDSLSSSGGIPYFKVSDMNEVGNELYLLHTNSFLVSGAKGRVFEKHTIVYPKNGGAVFTNKRRFLAERSVVDLNTGGYVADSCLDHNYAFDFLLNIDFKKICKGSALPTIDQQKLRNYLIPIPPISEQRRIVIRLNEIFALLDKAEDCYLRVQDLGKSLKNKFLQMAIEGKLVPQIDEEPSVEQIRDIPAEPPFEIPEKWKWVELSAVGNVVGGGTPSTSVLDYWDGTIPWLTPADMGKFTSKYVEKCSKFITQKGLDHSSAKLMPKGTVIYSSRAPIGYVAIAKDSICTNQGCKSLVPNTEFVISEYIYFCLINRTEDIKFRASGTTFKEISGRNFGETLIPLPPISEQRRIVARLNELFALVDKMTGVEERE